MRMKWAQLLFCSFFFFFCFSSIFIAKKTGTCYHFIDDVRVRVFAEAGFKDSSFFLRLNF